VKARRILIKLSGEALGGASGVGLDRSELLRFCDEIADAVCDGVQIAVVVGGGNILRGSQFAREGADRISGDHMGMLATVINALAIQDAMRSRKLPVMVYGSVEILGVCEAFTRDRAMESLDQGKVVVFGGGTGNPLFTTDSAAALRAVEIGADLLAKATKVDGVYDKDPKVHSDAKRFDCISYEEVLSRQLKVMDMTATALCMENNLPIEVFDFTQRGHLKRLLSGDNVGTLVGGGKHA
jgi:uridylate kinase